jgi:hypothetical protein
MVHFRMPSTASTSSTPASTAGEPPAEPKSDESAKPAPVENEPRKRGIPDELWEATLKELRVSVPHQFGKTDESS